MSSNALSLARRTLINGPAYEPGIRRRPNTTVGATERKSASASLGAPARLSLTRTAVRETIGQPRGQGSGGPQWPDGVLIVRRGIAMWAPAAHKATSSV